MGRKEFGLWIVILAKEDVLVLNLMEIFLVAVKGSGMYINM